MSSIITQTFADGADLGLQLESEEHGRAFAIGSDWTRIRVGILCNMIPSATSNILSGQIRLGFSSANSMQFGSQSAGLWYGGLVSSATNYTGSTYTYNANSGNPYFASGGIRRARALAGVLSGGGSAGSPSIAANTGTIKRRSVIMCELKKSGTSMIVGVGMFNGATGQSADHTLAEFREAMTNGDLTAGSAPTVGSDAMSHWGTDTFTSHDTNAGVHGETDAAQVGWNKGLVTFLNVFAIEVYRFD